MRVPDHHPHSCSRSESSPRPHYKEILSQASAPDTPSYPSSMLPSKLTQSPRAPARQPATTAFQMSRVAVSSFPPCESLSSLYFIMDAITFFLLTIIKKNPETVKSPDFQIVYVRNFEHKYLAFIYQSLNSYCLISCTTSMIVPSRPSMIPTTRSPNCTGSGSPTIAYALSRSSSMVQNGRFTPFMHSIRS